MYNDMDTKDFFDNRNMASHFCELCYEYLESIATAMITIIIIFSFIVRIVNVSGSSMMNTLRNNDKVVIWKWNYVPTNRDIVVIKKGQFLNEPIIKRVIATQGQSLSIDFSSGRVIVDGVALDEPYIPETMWLQGDADIPNVIPQGYTFVLGDNRNHSMDSRFKDVGLIDNNDIVGKACFVLFPISRLGIIN